MKIPPRPPAFPSRNPRRGAVLPLIALCMVTFVAMLALAIDVGMLTLARAETQDLADATAMAAARTVNGLPPGYNIGAVDAQVEGVVADTEILGGPADPDKVTITYGRYDYNPDEFRFEGNVGSGYAIPTLVRSEVEHDGTHFFGRVFGVVNYSVTSDAVAVHRPRDIAIVMDTSGSMRFGSESGGWPGHPSYDIVTSQSSDPDVPRFGHYTLEDGNAPKLVAAGGYAQPNEPYVLGVSNLTAPSDSGPAIVDDFRTGQYATGPAFADVADPDGDPSTPVAGDEPLREDEDDPADDYAATLDDVLDPYPGDTPADNPSAVFDWLQHKAWALLGYDAAFLKNRSGPFAGYTQAGGHWGKTFFIWPPDPRGAPWHQGTVSSDEAKAFLKEMYPFDWNDTTNGGDSRNFRQIWDQWEIMSESQMRNRLVAINDTPNGLGYHEGTENGRSRAEAMQFEYEVLMALFRRRALALGSGVEVRDWRRRFFTYPDKDAEDQDLNAQLYDANGNLKGGDFTLYVPQFDNEYLFGGDWKPNYQAIVQWIKNDGPNPFPSSLQCGRVRYYTLIPDTFPAYGGDYNQRFWRRYIDFVLATGGNQAGPWYLRNNTAAETGFGADFDWGGASISPKPAGRYMDYGDNPRRPKLHYWFGPLSMIDYIERFYGLPGACHEAQLWQAKAGIQSTLRDVEINHPNDRLAFATFSSFDLHQRTKVALGNDFDRLRDALWYPASTLVSKTPVWFEDAMEDGAPRAFGGTAASMGLVHAFNQFSSDTALQSRTTPPGLFGGRGRRGAQKLVILMSDGIPNQYVDGALVSQSDGQSYYDSWNGGDGNGPNSAVTVVEQMNRHEDAGGFATPSRPVRVHAIAFGDIFEANAFNANSQAALDFMRDVQVAGQTSDPGDAAIPAYKIVTGDQQTRIERLRDTLTRILQDGVQVALIE